MMHAYDESYLRYTMKNVAVMMYYGINVYGLSPNDFYDMFLESGVAEKISDGNPRYLCGLSGAELAELVIKKDEDDGKDLGFTGYYETTPEYWAGWALSYYQWYSCKSFGDIKWSGLTFDKVIAMYYPLHEADLTKFVEVVELLLNTDTPPTKVAEEFEGYTGINLH